MELYKKLNIEDTIYNDIIKRLKRVPNDFETYLFSAMHSEHCGYMHSKNYIKDFYKQNNYTDENAGCIKIKDYCLFFKMESHNHPCAIEPYQGSMTGIGGIIRDILALNCKPIALLNSIKFENTGYFLDEVTKGISDYGNSTGIPTITGETIFDKKYKNIPIVNVFASGIVHKDKIKLSSAKKDCLFVLLGSKTGIDGLNGANFASNPLSKEDKRESVQIADPYTKKKLIEATLQLNDLKTTIACQDLGAAGILSSTCEMAYKGNLGAIIYTDKIHCQNINLSPSDMMLSETQERMMFLIKKEGLKAFNEIAKKYELEYSIIGKIIDEKKYKVFHNKKELSNLDIDVLCNPWGYILKKNKSLKKEKKQKSLSFEKQFKNLLKDLNFSNKNTIFEQFDQEVGGITSFSQKENSFGIQYIDKTDSFIGYTIQSAINDNPDKNIEHSFLYCYKKLISKGFEPKGLTNCLNFSNPNYSKTQNDFLDTIETLKKLSFKYKIPVVSGNVSFYNEFENNRLFPTATLAFVGVAEKKDIIEFNINQNDKIYFLNEKELKQARNEILKNRYKCFPIGRLGLIGSLIKKTIFYNLGFKLNLKNDEYFKPYLDGFVIISDKNLNLPQLGEIINDKIIVDDLIYDIKEIKKYYDKF